MLDITVGIIAKNEERTIGECLKSIVPWVKEIIVVDNNSVDRTAEIAKEYGCIVIKSAAELECDLRNTYIEMAHHAWILTIDADERVTPEFWNSLEQFLLKVPADTFTVKIPINNYYGRGRWATFMTCRLIRNMSGLCYEKGSVHVSPVRAGERLGGKLGEFTEGEIHHLDALIKKRSDDKREGYREKILQQVLTTTDDVQRFKSLNYLGAEYMAVRDFSSAEQCFREVMAKCPRFEALATIYLLQCLKVKKEYEKLENELISFIGLPFEELISKSSCTHKKEKILEKRNLTEDFLHRIILIIAELALQKNEKEAAMQWIEFIVSLRPSAQQYINLASLKQGEEKEGLIKKALQMNSFLKKEIIYKNGAENNIYYFQSPFISEAEKVLEEFERQMY